MFLVQYLSLLKLEVCTRKLRFLEFYFGILGKKLLYENY